MMKLKNNSKSNWRTPFGSFCKVYGPRELAEDLSTITREQYTNHHIYRWVQGVAQIPTSAAHGLIKLSRKKLKMADIVNHMDSVGSSRRQVA